jgi:dihydropteroate synthase
MNSRRIHRGRNGLRGKIRIPISLDTQESGRRGSGHRRRRGNNNDVRALRSDPELGAVVRRHRVALILMHMRGTPGTMQQGPFARDVMRDVAGGLRAALARARRAKIDRSRLVIDPGIGFGKSYAQNCELLARLPELAPGLPAACRNVAKAFIAGCRGKKKTLCRRMNAFGALPRQ